MFRENFAWSLNLLHKPINIICLLHKNFEILEKIKLKQPSTSIKIRRKLVNPWKFK
jgi:hypothetical protein